MVRVKYGEPYKTSFGKMEEKIKANTLGSLLEKIEKKYENKEYTDTISRYSKILLNNEIYLSINNLEYKLKPKDEILIIQLMNIR